MLSFCVEVVTSRYGIVVQARHQLSLSFPHFEHRVHLVLHNFLSPSVEMEFEFTQLLVAFMSNKLLLKRLHQ